MSGLKIKSLSELLPKNSSGAWKLRAYVHDDCLAYAAWNEKTNEALLVDPKEEDLPSYLLLKEELKGYLWIAVIDTHTHADHISCAAAAAEKFIAPLVMHEKSPSRRVQLRVSDETFLPARAGAVQLIPTPGHTPDGITVLWGPFLFTGDTILFNDVGRDDLPGGDAKAHYDSVQLLRRAVSPEAIVLPGHDAKGGRAALWSSQLESNLALTQGREEFVRECEAFEAPAPANFKKSLVENFR